MNYLPPWKIVQKHSQTNKSNIEKAKSKRILNKFPKICNHINKSKQLMETKQTKCCNKAIFEFVSMKANCKW